MKKHADTMNRFVAYFVGLVVGYGAAVNFINGVPLWANAVTCVLLTVVLVLLLGLLTVIGDISFGFLRLGCKTLWAAMKKNAPLKDEQ